METNNQRHLNFEFASGFDDTLCDNITFHDPAEDINEYPLDLIVGKENPERFTGMDEGKLWVVLELNSQVSPPTLAYEIWQAGGGLLERRDLSWEEINGRAAIAPTPMPLVPARMEAKATKAAAPAQAPK